MYIRKIIAVSLAAFIFIFAGTNVLASGKTVKAVKSINIPESSATSGNASAITITQQPESQTVIKGKSLTVSVSAQGTGLSYQWYYKKKGQESFSVWKGRVSAKETVTPNDTWDGIQLRCLIKDSSGNSVTSEAATITFASELRITKQPESCQIYSGEKVTVSVTALGEELTYQWYYKKVGQDLFSAWKNHTNASETAESNDSWNGIMLYCKITDKFGNSVKSDAAVVTFINDPEDEKPWKGLKVSVLGDSISTYKGWSEHNTYYTSSKIPSVNSMWWKQVCEILGAEPLVIEARASSCCAVSDVAWTRDITPAVDDSRCKNLHKDNTEPDIIFIAMGVNDFQANVPLGDWDGHSELSPDDVRTWRGAYANTIQKIHQRYPYALVFCLSPFYFVRGSSATVNVNKHGTYKDYEDAMKEVCELLQCVYIDANNFGFTRQNYTSQNFVFDDHTADGSLFHPNATGQEILGQCIAAEAENKAVGYNNWLRKR